MPIKNLIGIEKPLVKLVETISEGVGVVGNEIFKFDAKKIKRIGLAEAEVEKQKIIAKAEGQEEAVEVLNRASKRFALSQYNKQINLENIIVKAKNNIQDKIVSEMPVEKDWTMKFLDIAQDVSREDMQEILAKILAGEVEKPGSFSLRTLETVKYLSRDDLQKFQKFIAISSDDGLFNFSTSTIASFMSKYDLKFADYLILVDLGLFKSSFNLTNTFDLKKGRPGMLNIGRENFFVSTELEEKLLALKCIMFTTVGRELYPILLNNSVNEKYELYKLDFTQHIESQGVKVLSFMSKQD